MTEPSQPGMRLRLIGFRVAIVVAFLALIGQLWRLQMLEGDYYRRAADINRFRLELNPAPRGVIYDRRGYLLARNMPQSTVSVIPAYLPEDGLDLRRLDLLDSRRDRFDLIAEWGAFQDAPLDHFDGVAHGRVVLVQRAPDLLSAVKASQTCQAQLQSESVGRV